MRRLAERTRAMVRERGVRAAGAHALVWPFLFGRWQLRRLRSQRIADLETREERFAFIYRHNLWGDSSSRSGFGSSVAATENIRRELPRIVADLGIRSILDAPCGDFAWMSTIIPTLPDVRIIGADIVPAMIERNQARFESDAVSFRHLDLCNDPLPTTDLMLCRDLLLHLSYGDAHEVLKNFVTARIPLLLTTTHINTDGFENHDIVSGSWRRIDLFRPPFNFPREPLLRFADGIPPDPPHELCLFSREQVRLALERFGWN